MRQTSTGPASPADLLAAARNVCRGGVPIPGMSRARAACLLARQAMEQVIDALLAQRQLGCPAASARVRLICLAEAFDDDPEVGRRAAVAWDQLSSACHQHAYELGPTLGEAENLVNDVMWLTRRLE